LAALVGLARKVDYAVANTGNFINAEEVTKKSGYTTHIGYAAYLNYFYFFKAILTFERGTITIRK
jgi:hypothetical protein